MTATDVLAIINIINYVILGAVILTQRRQGRALERRLRDLEKLHGPSADQLHDSLSSHSHELFPEDRS